jgi:hypothetical protein
MIFIVKYVVFGLSKFLSLCFSLKDVAAACVFLTTKTEECGRKLKDVARVCQAKIHSTDVNNIPADGKVCHHSEYSSCVVIWFSAGS